MKTRRRVFGSALALGVSAVTLAGCNELAGVQPVYSSTCDSRFQVVNQSGAVIERLYFSHSSQGNWGADQLGNNVLANGRMMTFRAANAGNHDFRVVWANGRSAELRQVNVCQAARITVTSRGLYAS